MMIHISFREVYISVEILKKELFFPVYITARTDRLVSQRQNHLRKCLPSLISAYCHSMVIV